MDGVGGDKRRGGQSQGRGCSQWKWAGGAKGEANEWDWQGLGGGGAWQGCGQWTEGAGQGRGWAEPRGGAEVAVVVGMEGVKWGG